VIQHVTKAVFWRLIQKIYPVELSRRKPLLSGVYEVDPLACPKCQGSMRVIASIEDSDLSMKKGFRSQCNKKRVYFDSLLMMC